MLQLRVIRSKSNINLIRSFGTTVQGGLGEFDPEIWEEVEVDELPKDYQMYVEKPPPTGKDLIKFINETTVERLSDEQAFALITKVQPFILFLEQGRCNPLKKETFNTALKLLDRDLENGSKSLLIELVMEWAIKFNLTS